MAAFFYSLAARFSFVNRPSIHERKRHGVTAGRGISFCFLFLFCFLLLRFFFVFVFRFFFCLCSPKNGNQEQIVLCCGIHSKYLVNRFPSSPDIFFFVISAAPYSHYVQELHIINKSDLLEVGGRTNSIVFRFLLLATRGVPCCAPRPTYLRRRLCI